MIVGKYQTGMNLAVRLYAANVEVLSEDKNLYRKPNERVQWCCIQHIKI